MNSPQFALHIPAKPLSDYIECLWMVKADNQELITEKVLPNGVMELIINLGGHFRVQDEEEATDKLVKDGWLSGLHKTFITIEQLGSPHMFGVRFKAGGAYPFLQMPCSEVSGLVLEMELLWGRAWMQETRERLLEVDSTSGRFQLLESLLLKRLSLENLTSPMIHYATRRLISHSEGLSIRQLADDIGVSPQHLNRQFDVQVGLSAKTMERIYKFQRALQAIDQSQPVRWADLAETCGYYDQAHLIRDFKSFSGLTPAQYVKERGGDLNHVPLPKRT